MKLEDQVAPLKQALRMKELGFPQETFAAWRSYPGEAARVMAHETIAAWAEERSDLPSSALLCAAPTVAEMGEWMPRSERIGRPGWRDGKDYACYEDGADMIGVNAATMAEAMAERLVRWAASVAALSAIARLHLPPALL
jgi:hypothetical protein